MQAFLVLNDIEVHDLIIFIGLTGEALEVDVSECQEKWELGGAWQDFVLKLPLFLLSCLGSHQKLLDNMIKKFDTPSELLKYLDEHDLNGFSQELLAAIYLHQDIDQDQQLPLRALWRCLRYPTALYDGRHAHHPAHQNGVYFGVFHASIGLGLLVHELDVLLKINLCFESTEYHDWGQEETLLDGMVVRAETSHQPLEGVVQIGAHLVTQVTSRILLFDRLLGLLLDLALLLLGFFWCLAVHAYFAACLRLKSEQCAHYVIWSLLYSLNILATQLRKVAKEVSVVHVLMKFLK